MLRLTPVFLIISFLAILCPAADAAKNDGQAYDPPEKIVSSLKELTKENGKKAQMHVIAETPGGREVVLMELSAGGEVDSGRPAVLVVANMTGDCPLASEAALRLAGLLCGKWSGDLESLTWYIVPVGNPDGYARYFDRPLDRNFLNGRVCNSDNDDRTDEDGPEDLNGDGFITVMRQKHPEGKWIALEGNPLLMKMADAGKGEKGEYRLFAEGIDDDGDGKINEDGPGGVDPGRNFPHDFRHYTKTSGPWAASEEESRAILRFAFDHPSIAMVLAFGRSNTLRAVPESSRKTARASSKYKVPSGIAKQMGIDPDEEFSLPDLVEMAKAYTGYSEIDEDMVLSFLGVGAAVNPDMKDLPYWNEISSRYKDFIKEAGLDGDRLDPPPSPPGSLEEWAYYQYGVPAFAVDFWTLPVKKKEEDKKEGELTSDDIEKMSNEEFLALGEDRIKQFLADNDAPPQFSAQMVMMGLKGGMVTTKKIAEFMSKSEKKKDSGGADETDQALIDFDRSSFLEWRPYDHPDLGAVEIGGRIPCATLAPPPAAADSLLDAQLPFVRELAKMLPSIEIGKVAVEKLGQDIWKIESWVVNNGFLPFPTHQGQRCRRPSPVSVEIDGDLTMIEGRRRVVTGLLDGSGGFRKVTWIVRAKEGKVARLTARSFSAGVDVKKVEFGKGGGE